MTQYLFFKTDQNESRAYSVLLQKNKGVDNKQRIYRNVSKGHGKQQHSKKALKINQLFFEKQLVKLCLYILCLVLYASICDKGQFGNKVKRDCRIAVFYRSYDRLKT